MWETVIDVGIQLLRGWIRGKEKEGREGELGGEGEGGKWDVLAGHSIWLHVEEDDWWLCGHADGRHAQRRTREGTTGRPSPCLRAAGLLRPVRRIVTADSSELRRARLAAAEREMEVARHVNGVEMAAGRDGKLLASADSCELNAASSRCSFSCMFLHAAASNTSTLKHVPYRGGQTWGSAGHSGGANSQARLSSRY